jgi:hypothetical protein
MFTHNPNNNLRKYPHCKDLLLREEHTNHLCKNKGYFYQINDFGEYRKEWHRWRGLPTM